MENPIINDNKTCYNCGKIFRTPAEFERHKKRKTPCLIREIKPEDKNNPLRCIYCNKVFSKANNLNQHNGRCKIKNGGLQTLHDKVKHEEEIRILKEKQELQVQESKDIKEMMSQMKAKIDALEAQNKELKAGTIVNTGNGNINGNVVNNNIVNNTINNTVNIHINNYDKPNVEHLKNLDTFKKLFNYEMSGTPIALVEKIWYDPEHPENIAIHLVNKKTGETLVVINGKWVTDNISNIIPMIRHITYELTQSIMVNNFERLITFNNDFVPKFLEQNRKDPGAIKRDCDDILQKMIDGRAISQAVVAKK
jgi:Zinc finger, C2H2 type